MGHDDHFLRRLDRVDREHVELALGLYRDHELVHYVLTHARVPEGAERIAIALEDGGEGPHIIVARSGAFVTCLGRGMGTGAWPIVTRAHMDGLVNRVERVRDGVALARRCGVDQARLLGRIESAGPRVSREDFIGASAMLAPAIPLIMGVYSSWAGAMDEMYPLLQSGRRNAPIDKESAQDLARGAWAMGHSAMLLVDTASREWVRDWAKLPAHQQGSPWNLMVRQSAFPFVIRSAWIAGRLGKPFLSSYKVRYAQAPHPLELLESGWGLMCMALRHANLRAEALRALRTPPAAESVGERGEWARTKYALFAAGANLVEEQEALLRDEAMQLGRDFVLLRTRGLPESSRFRFTEREQVPADLVLPALFDAWYDGVSGESAMDLMLNGVVAASQARAEDFYFPATVLHALGTPDLEGMGTSLIQMRRTLLGESEPIRVGDKPGRNDPCPCGNGKKYKKCHGR